MRRLTKVASACIRSSDVKPEYTQLYINGRWQKSVGGQTFDIVNPANGEFVCEFASANESDVDIAVAAAGEAYKSWKYVAPGERGAYLNAFADLLEENLDEISALEALDNGKPFEMVRTVDAPLTIQQFRYFAGWADKLEGRTLDMGGDFLINIMREPIGVCGQVIPWNFPLLMFAWKVAPAIACGNTVVIKSARLTPLSAAFATELFDRAGLPPGVVNTISGPGTTAGRRLASHPDVAKVSFTGSTPVGQDIMVAAGESNVKSISLELGGKSPLIVCNDMKDDIELAAQTAMQGCFFNQGQVCCAATRIMVQDEIYDPFIERCAEIANSRVVGDPFQPGVEQGPQVSEEQMNIILDYCEQGKKSGATLVAGGHRLGDSGFYVAPTIFGDVEDEMSICAEEIFGPVVSVQKFRHLDEAISRANDTTFGLAAGIMTPDITKAMKAVGKLEAGTVWVNCWNIFDANLPFGGYKMSGFGKDSSVYALRNFTKEKAVCISVPGLKSVS